MLKYWLSVPLIGITLLLTACSDGPSSSGGVTLYTGGGGPFTLTVENQGGHGAIEVCLDDGQACTNTNRIAVAQGQCKAGVGSCTQTIETTKSEVANGLKIVWSALHTGPNQSYLATAYTCSPGSKGCTTGKTDHMAKLNAAKTQIQTVIKVDANSGSATIGGTFSKDKPETGGVNYCWNGGAFSEGNVKATGPFAAACQADINALVAQFGVRARNSSAGRNAHNRIFSFTGGSCTAAGRDMDDCSTRAQPVMVPVLGVSQG
jgi:hypothetical protein